MYIVMEYCAGGTLLSIINNHIRYHSKFTEKQVATTISQLVHAVDYLYKNKIIHRDIKPENIMYVRGAPGVGDGKIKLIDFGAATKLGHGKTINQEMYGAANYMSPEMLRGTYDHKTDVWSIGVIAWLMLTKKQPFEGRNDKDVIDEVLNKILDMQELD